MRNRLCAVFDCLAPRVFGSQLRLPMWGPACLRPHFGFNAIGISGKARL